MSWRSSWSKLILSVNTHTHICRNNAKFTIWVSIIHTSLVYHSLLASTNCQMELPELLMRYIFKVSRCCFVFHHVCLASLICYACFFGRWWKQASNRCEKKKKSLYSLMISFHFTLFLQMLGEQFTPRHTSRRKWCSCSGVKASLPSWPPSSRSLPRLESYSPSTSQNTGNPSVILFILACSAFFFFPAQLHFHGLLNAPVLN